MAYLLLTFAIFQLLQSVLLVSSPPPQIALISANDRPRNVSIPVNKTYLASLILPDHTLHLKYSFRDVIIECQSDAPVRWNFSGVTSPLDLNLTFTRWLPLESTKEIFIARLRIRRVSSHITGKWICSHVAPPHDKKWINIFADEHSYQGKPPVLLQYGETKTLSARENGRLVFPCVSWKQTANLKLSLLMVKGSRLDYIPIQEPHGFEPVEGFIFNSTPSSFFGYTFVCYEDYNATVDKQFFTVQQDFGVSVNPEVPTIDLKEGDTLELTCTSKDPSVQFGFQVVPDFPERQIITQLGQSYRFQMPDVNIHDMGHVLCIGKSRLVSSSEATVVFTHRWDYKVFRESDLKNRGIVYYRALSTHLDNWVCRSKSSNTPSVAFVRCTNPMECDVRSQCFQSSHLCDPIDSRSCSGGCILLQLSNTPGKMTCKGDGGNFSEQIFFGAADSSVWYNESSGGIKVEDRLRATRVKRSEKITFTGEEVTYFCNGSAMFFTQGFYWSIRIMNGTSFRLDSLRNETKGIVSLTKSSEIAKDTGVILVESTIAIHTLDATEISCVAPHWDSLNTSSFPLSLNMSRSVKPTFSDKMSQVSVTLALGDSETAIPCEIALAHPTPFISWTRDGKPILENDTDFSIHLDGLTLKGGVTKYIAGEYQCIAKNPAGRSVKTITVYVKDARTNLLVGISVAAVVVLILLVLLYVFWRKIQRQKEMLRNLTEDEIHEFLYGKPDALDATSDTNRQGHCLAYNREYEFPRDFLLFKTEDKLGAGAYGLVLKGTARGLFSDEDNEETTVAVKTLQTNADITYFKALLMELKIMSVIGRNPYILNLLGACTTGIRNREIYIIVEYCGKGSLDAFLKAHRHDFPANNTVRYSVEPSKESSFLLYENTAPQDRLTIGIMTRWCYEIARGMEYLESKKVIHGDLAARNVLLTDNLMTKIGDFGLSRQLYEYTNYVKKNQAPLPWRWMALESLTDMEFSHKSDVWAYGVTLWEIFSLGELPYPGMSWTEEFMKKLRQGHRPSHPPLASPQVYERMSGCWLYEARNRPSFSELAVSFLSLMGREGVGHLEPQAPPPRRNFRLEINNESYGAECDNK